MSPLKKELTEQLEGLRVHQDYLLRQITIYKNSRSNREVSAAYTALELSRMFLGKAMGSIGYNPNPYPESKNPQNDSIEPASDKFTDEAAKSDTEAFLDDDNAVAANKQLRSDIDGVSRAIRTMFDYFDSNMEYQEVIRKAWLESSSAVMWLGADLGKQRDEAEPEKTEEPVKIGGNLSVAKMQLGRYTHLIEEQTVKVNELQGQVDRANPEEDISEIEAELEKEKNDLADFQSKLNYIENKLKELEK